MAPTTAGAACTSCSAAPSWAAGITVSIRRWLTAAPTTSARGGSSRRCRSISMRRRSPAGSASRIPIWRRLSPTSATMPAVRWARMSALSRPRCDGMKTPERPPARDQSPPLRLELLHILHQPLHALDRHGVVDRSAHAADGAVAFELHHAARLRPFQEFAVELGVRECERDIHARAVGLAHRVLEKGAGVEE